MSKLPSVCDLEGFRYRSISLSVGPEANPVLPVQAKKFDPVENLSRRNLAIRGGMPVWWVGAQEASLGRFFLNVFFTSPARGTRSYLRSHSSTFFLSQFICYTAVVILYSPRICGLHERERGLEVVSRRPPSCCSFSQQSGSFPPSASPLRIHFIAFALVCASPIKPEHACPALDC